MLVGQFFLPYLRLLEHALFEFDLRHLHRPAFVAATQIFQIAITVDENHIVFAILGILSVGGEIRIQRRIGGNNVIRHAAPNYQCAATVGQGAFDLPEGVLSADIADQLHSAS